MELFPRPAMCTDRSAPGPGLEHRTSAAAHRFRAGCLSLWGLVLLAAFITLAPANAQDTAPASPAGAIDVDSDLTTDAAIERRIRGILSELDGFDRVFVDVNAGVVTLRGRVLDGTELERLEALVSRVEGVVAIENEVTETTDVSDRLAPAVERLSDRATQALALAPLALVALLAFVLVVTIGFFLASRRQPFERLAPNPFIADIYRQILRVLSVIVGVVLVLDLVGATALLGTVLGAAGIVGLAIGFAVRDTVENFIASILLSIRQPFRPNDFVSIEGELGHVIRLTSRATVLLSIDGNHVRIPNATVFKSTITNYTRNPERRFEFELGVDADADLAAALNTGLSTIEALPFVLEDPSAAGWVDSVGDSNVVLKFSAWIDQRETAYLRSRGEAIRLVKTALEGAGIGLPEPIYRLRVDGDALPLSSSERPATPSEPRTPTVPEKPVAAQSTEPDEGIEKKIDEERAEAGEDLLSEAAPQE